MGFGDSAGGLLEGFRMANQDLQAKHQQLMNDAISQAQMQHAQQELDQQKTSETNLNNNRIAQQLSDFMGHLKDYQKSGGTGAAFAAMYRPILGASGLGENKNALDLLESMKNQGQTPEYIQSVQDAKDNMTAEAAKAKLAQDNAMRKMFEDHFQYLTGKGVDVDSAKQESQAMYPMSGSGGGQSTAQTPSSSVFPDDHSQLVSDAIAKASKGSPAPVPGTMQMPSGATAPSLSAMWQQMQTPQASAIQSSPTVPPQELPPAGGVAAQPVPGSSPPGAGLPQSMVNPTAPITGDPNAANAGSSMPNDGTQSPNGGTLPPGLPAPPQPITMVPTGLHGVLPGVALEQRAKEQEYQQKQLAMAVDAEKLREMPIEFNAKQKADALKAIHENQDIANEKMLADQALKLFPLKLSGIMVDQWATKQGVAMQNARLAFDKVKFAADRADKLGGKMTAGEVTGAYSNARQLLDLKKDLSAQLQANQTAETKAKWYADPKNVPVPDPSDASYAKVMQNKSESIASTTGAYDPVMHRPGPSPLEAQRNILQYSLDQANDLYDKTQMILNQIGPKPTSLGGKPDKVFSPTSGNTFPGAPPGTIGNGKAKLLMPPTPGAKGLAKVSPPTGKVDYSKMTTGEIAKRMADKLKAIK